MKTTNTIANAKFGSIDDDTTIKPYEIAERPVIIIPTAEKARISRIIRDNVLTFVGGTDTSNGRICRRGKGNAMSGQMTTESDSLTVSAHEFQIDLTVVVPVLNEEETVELFVSAVAAVLEEAEVSWEILFVDDGSTDATVREIGRLSQKDRRIRAIILSRNFGKEIALCAGIDEARGKAVVPMDVDLQDPPEILIDMIKLWRDGYEIVQGKRIDRRSDSFAKRATASTFYHIINFMSPIQIPEHVGDFRLLGERAVAALRLYRERERFMKGIFASLGFKTATVEYARKPRKQGSTKFSPFALAQLSIQGITSYSAIPLKIWTYLGAIIAVSSLLYAVFIAIRTLAYGIVIPGYASLVVIVLFLNGLTLIGLGIQGEYLARVFMEVKQRPLYIIGSRIEN